MASGSEGSLLRASSNQAANRASGSSASVKSAGGWVCSVCATSDMASLPRDGFADAPDVGRYIVEATDRDYGRRGAAVLSCSALRILILAPTLGLEWPGLEPAEGPE